MKRQGFYDSSYSLGRVQAHGLGDSQDYPLEGIVFTPHGIVYVVGMMHGAIHEHHDGKGKPHWGPTTRLWFMWKGRHHDRSYPSLLNARQAARAAGTFVREIARKRG